MLIKDFPIIPSSFSKALLLSSTFIGFSILIKEATHSETGLCYIINLGCFIIDFNNCKFIGVPHTPLVMM